MAGSQIHISNCSERVKLKFWIFFFHGCIRNKKFCKAKNFQVWVPHDNFEYRAKKKGLRGKANAVQICGKVVYLIHMFRDGEGKQHFDLFPRTLGDILTAFNVQELKLSLTQVSHSQFH